MKAAALLLLAVLCGCIDHRAEFAKADRIETQERAHAKAERLQRVAQAMCESDHGPNVQAIWIDPITVECVNAHGRRVADFAMEVSHGQ